MGKTIGDKIPEIRNRKPKIKRRLTLTRLGRIFRIKKYQA